MVLKKKNFMITQCQNLNKLTHLYVMNISLLKSILFITNVAEEYAYMYLIICLIYAGLTLTKPTLKTH